MPKAPITNIIFGTMTLGYRGYGARVHYNAITRAVEPELFKCLGNYGIDAIIAFGV